MKLELGMYVRTKDGEIGIVISDERIAFAKDYAKIEYLVFGDEIVNASNNLIDLIEVGDYVNGYKVTSIQEVEEPYYPKRLLFFEEPQDYILQCFNNEDIKSMVTKEQFESIEYRLEG